MVQHTQSTQTPPLAANTTKSWYTTLECLAAMLKMLLRLSPCKHARNKSCHWSGGSHLEEKNGVRKLYLLLFKHYLQKPPIYFHCSPPTLPSSSNVISSAEQKLDTLSLIEIKNKSNTKKKLQPPGKLIQMKTAEMGISSKYKFKSQVAYLILN